ncbi:MAG: NAD(P)H-hydrate dehydratase [Eubacterium sp.]|nr:NAD(P)H-hydrate dehydratase [Eubacterium sp.]
MKVLSADEIRLVEQRCFERYSTEAELMFKAGYACYNEIIRKYENEIKGAKVSVFCGNGKNAGDGFVIARLLSCYGADASIVLVDKEPSIAEPLMYFEQAVNSGVKVEYFTNINNEMASKNQTCDNVKCNNFTESNFIIDCIFGIGFHGRARGAFNDAFKAVNESAAKVIAIDTPSGSNATTGEVCANAVKADFTIAISTLKYAHILPPANSLCGEIKTVDIGIPNDCYDSDYTETIEFDDVKNCFSPREKNSNKGTFGHQLNICSSKKMFGAGVIATQAALRSGAGLVKLMLPLDAFPLAAAHLTQCLFEPALQTVTGTFSRLAAGAVKEQLKWASSVVIGCGIDVNDDTKEITELVLKKSRVPIILDADGINCINGRISIFKEIKAPVVLTPHPMEMSRLISKPIAEIQGNRINTAKAFAKENGIILVLKGANTVVTDGEKVFVNLTGNPSMAMGGTGDMLSGMIGSFISQGMSAFDAARCAVCIHGLCGDIAAKELSQRGILVSDMIDRLGALMSEFE